MNIIKSNNHIDQFLDSFFNSSIGDIIGSDFVNNQPAVNIVEEDQRFKINLAVPGFSKDDFQIDLADDQMVISAKNANDETTEDKKQGWTRREFDYSSFKRSFRLPKNVDIDSIDAVYKNGLLVISIDKKEAVKTARTINIG